MAAKRTNLLREYHLLIVRVGEGFVWQVRYDRHANPVERGTEAFKTHEDALKAGEQALERHRGAVKNGA